MLMQFLFPGPLNSSRNENESKDESEDWTAVFIFLFIKPVHSFIRRSVWQTHHRPASQYVWCIYRQKWRRECSVEWICWADVSGNVWTIKLGKQGHRSHDFSSYMTCTMTIWTWTRCRGKSYIAYNILSL